MTFDVYIPTCCKSRRRMPRERINLARTALFTVLGVAALAISPLVARPARADTQTIHFTDSCPPPVPGAPYGPLGQLCAMVSVPLDYRNPNGRHILVAVSMIPAAKPNLRRGVLFLNPGGPGGDQALDMPRVFTFLFSGTASQSILDEYDLIGFDPRGNNHSSPVTCGLTEQQTDQLVPTFEQDDSFDATTAFVKSVAAGCAKNSGPLLPFMTTINTVRDMDAMRKGLGEAKINYFAWSYGSYLGAAYASLYPNNTDRVVIDSSVDPNWVWRTQFRKWGLGGQQRWPDFANFAAANDATYHFGSTPDQVTALFFKLMAQADAHPFQDSAFYTDGTLINGAAFQAVAFSSLENDLFFPSMVQLFQDTEAATGGTSAASRTGGTDSARPALSSPVVATSSTTAAVNPAETGPGPIVLPRDIQVPADNPTASGLTVLCSDVQWSRNPLQYQAELEQDIQTYPMFGQFGSNIWPCAFWPTAPIEPPVQINSNGPANILMIQNQRDPNTPYAGAQEMHTALGQRSRLVTIDGGGHAVFGLEPNSVCAANFVTDYLANGAFPDQDEFCPASPAASSQANPATATAATDANAAAKDWVRRRLLRQMGLQGLK